jgi:hypothetical protein
MDSAPRRGSGFERFLRIMDVSFMSEGLRPNKRQDLKNGVNWTAGNLATRTGLSPPPETKNRT